MVLLPPQAERALTLWRNELISLDSLKSAQKSSSGIIKLVNKLTGKRSGKSTDFTQANWASVTAEYFSSIKTNFRDVNKFNRIVEEVNAFVKSSRHGDSKTVPSSLNDTEPLGECALLIDDSDTE
jgi:hypothetical protein